MTGLSICLPRSTGFQTIKDVSVRNIERIIPHVARNERTAQYRLLADAACVIVH
jgi:hypothetical protein